MTQTTVSLASEVCNVILATSMQACKQPDGRAAAGGNTTRSCQFDPRVGEQCGAKRAYLNTN